MKPTEMTRERLAEIRKQCHAVYGYEHPNIQDLLATAEAALDVAERMEIGMHLGFAADIADLKQLADRLRGKG